MFARKNRPWFKFYPKNVPYHIDYPEIPLFQLLADTAMRYSEATAFSCRGVALSYGQLNTITNKLTLVLRNIGAKKRDRVVVFLANSLQFVISYYGIMKAGAIAVPTDPLFREFELQQRINDAKAKIMITNKELYPLVRKVTRQAKVETLLLPGDEDIGMSWVEKLVEGKTLASIEVDIKPKQDVVTILYTGGTTGMPKGVMLTHYNLVANAVQNATWFDWSHQDVVIGLLPFYHTRGLCTCINSPVYVGARVIILPRFDADELLQTVEKERATVLYSAASLFAMLIDSLKSYCVWF